VQASMEMTPTKTISASRTPTRKGKKLPGCWTSSNTTILAAFNETIYDYP
jgi:hypothetical protein